MLPKLWKKVLLAICIIACLFNIISKLVNRNSLEINLKSANDGKTIWEALKKDEPKDNPEYIDEMKSSTNTEYINKENTVSREEIIYNTDEEFKSEEDIGENKELEEDVADEEVEKQEVPNTMNFSDNLKTVMNYFDN